GRTVPPAAAACCGCTQTGKPQSSDEWGAMAQGPAQGDQPHGYRRSRRRAAGRDGMLRGSYAHRKGRGQLGRRWWRGADRWWPSRYTRPIRKTTEPRSKPSAAPCTVYSEVTRPCRILNQFYGRVAWPRLLILMSERWAQWRERFGLRQGLVLIAALAAAGLAVPSFKLAELSSAR